MQIKPNWTAIVLQLHSKLLPMDRDLSALPYHMLSVGREEIRVRICTDSWLVVNGLAGWLGTTMEEDWIIKDKAFWKRDKCMNIEEWVQV